MSLAPTGIQMRTQITKAPFVYRQDSLPKMTLLHNLTSHLFLTWWQPLKLVLMLPWNGIWFNNLQFPNALLHGLLVPLSLKMQIPSTIKMFCWTRQDAPFQMCAWSAALLWCSEWVTSVLNFSSHLLLPGVKFWNQTTRHVAFCTE